MHKLVAIAEANTQLSFDFEINEHVPFKLNLREESERKARTKN